MKIYDCFQFFDEEMLLDLRLNIMNKYVDKFVITEATYMHNGKSKKLNFDIKKYSKFKEKIIYIVVEDQPKDLFKIYNSDKNTRDTRGQKLVLNGYKRDNYQRQMALSALKNIDVNDWIIISDIDEIPKLENINLKDVKNKIVIFKQKIFYYKFNLIYPNILWHGSKMCRKKDFISPQWLRNIKHKIYPYWRLDTIFSKKKYSNILHVDDGGWHFTNIKSPVDIEKKLLNYTHHYEFEQSQITLDDLKKRMSDKKIIYDHDVDQRKSKWNSNKTLEIAELSVLPDYINDNYDLYSNWLEK